MTDDKWEYDTDDFEETPVDDPPAGEQQSDDDNEESPNDSWRFSVDDVKDGGSVEADADGWLNLYEEIEAGSPNLENVLFVAIGVTLGLLLAWQLFL